MHMRLVNAPLGPLESARGSTPPPCCVLSACPRLSRKAQNPGRGLRQGTVHRQAFSVASGVLLWVTPGEAWCLQG